MTVWVRNLHVPDVGGRGDSRTAIVVRELLRVARWTEQSNDADPNWPDPGSPNFIAGPTDLQVDPLYPRRITSLSSPFTSAMVGDMIALLATNDQNRSIWKIAKYIDANNIEVDDQGFTPWNWVLESGITGRVTTVTSALTGGADALWNAPGSNNMQARLEASGGDYVYFYVRPKGKVPLATECAAIGYLDGADLKMRAHMVAEDENALIWWSTEDTALEVLMWGSLIDTDAADTDPNFILGKAAATGSPLHVYGMRMLDGADADIAAYPTVPKKDWTASYANNYFTYFNARLSNNGKALLRSPWVCLGNVATAGACIRGRIPFLAQTYEGYERLRPLDAAGLWLHTYQGVVVPRNGPDDKLPLIPV